LLARALVSPDVPLSPQDEPLPAAREDSDSGFAFSHALILGPAVLNELAARPAGSIERTLGSLSAPSASLLGGCPRERRRGPTFGRIVMIHAQQLHAPEVRQWNQVTFVILALVLLMLGFFIPG
jgi:hypothetical protein